jgi:glyoxylase-like metal-dependent hydrolase (beta-lactamase superfamily II)
MRFKGLDLNLLVALDTLVETRSVSRSAERMNLSQPAMSSALGRLRDYFKDDILVSHGKRMHPTAYAESLLPQVREALRGIEALIGTSTQFDPATSPRTFRLIASDYITAALVVPLVARLSEVAPNVRRLSGGICNLYLIEEGGRCTLVDAGAPKDWDLFAATIGRLDALDAVLLTHAHADHVGIAERARKETGSTVRVHSDDAEVARTGKPGKNERSIAKYLLRPEFYVTAFSLARRGAAKLIPIAEVSTFADGATLDVPGRPRVVHAPGHTPAASALLFERNRALVSGDVIVTHNALTGRDGPQIMPSAFNTDSQQALRSLDALSGIEADVILPGHGVPWTGGVPEAISRARAAGPS